MKRLVGLPERWLNTSVQNRLVAEMVALLIISFCITIIGASWYLNNAVMRQVDRVATDALQNGQESYMIERDRLLGVARLLGNEPAMANAIIQGDRAGITSRLDSSLLNLTLDRVEVVDGRGQVLAVKPDTVFSAGSEESVFVQKVLQGQPVAGLVTRDYMRLQAGVPVKQGDKVVGAVIVSRYATNIFPAPRSGYSWTQISTLDNATLWGGAQVPDEVIGAVKRGQTGQATGQTVSGPALFAAVPILDSDDKTGGALVVVEPLGDSYTLLGNLLVGQIILGAIALIAAAVLAMLFSRRLTRRIQHLQIATAAVAAGDLDRSLTVSGADEITALSQSFSRMVNTLKRRLDESKSLLMVSRALVSEYHLTPLLGLIAEQARLLTGSDRAVFYMLSDDGEWLENFTPPTDPAAASEPANGQIRFHIEEGTVAGLAIRTGQPQYSNDTANDPRLESMRDQISVINARSMLHVPLRNQNGIVGTLAVYNKAGSGYTEEDMQALSHFAEQASLAIGNARLYEQAQTRADQLAILNEIGRSMAAQLDRPALFEAIYAGVRQVMDADAFLIILTPEQGDPSRNELEFAYQVDDGIVYPPEMRRISGTVIRQVLESGESLVINDYAAYLSKHHLSEIYFGNTGRTSESLIYAPLKIGDKSTGVISAQSYRPNAYRDEDRMLLVTLASQAAIAIENARLYAQAGDAAVLQERNRLARELHDSVTQSLFTISLTAQALPRLIERDPKLAAERLSQLQNLSQDALAEMRALIFELRPAALREAGFAAALRQMASLRSRENFQVEVMVEGERRLLPEAEEALYAVAREALSNAIRHSRGDHVWMHLVICDDTASLVVEDNGIGWHDGQGNPLSSLPERGDHGGYGVASMRERVEHLGGALKIAPILSPGHGIRVRATIPVD